MKTATRWQQEAAQWLGQHYRMRIRGGKKEQGGHENSMWRRLDRHLLETMEHQSWSDKALQYYIKRYGQNQRHAEAVERRQGWTTREAGAKGCTTRARARQAKGADAGTGKDVGGAFGADAEGVTCGEGGFAENGRIGLLQKELEQQTAIANKAVLRQQSLEKTLAAIQAQVAQLAQCVAEHTAQEAPVPAS